MGDLMNTGPFKLVFKPFTGTFELERQPEEIVEVTTSSGLTGASVSSGTLYFTEDLSVELAGDVGVLDTGELNLAVNSELTVL